MIYYYRYLTVIIQYLALQYVYIYLFISSKQELFHNVPPSLLTETTFTTDVDTLTVQELIDHTDQADTSSFLQPFDRVTNLLL